MATYAVSDLHGNYQLLEQILTDLKENDTVYCLGDCGDRGSDSLRVIQTVLKDPRFIYLFGNHECMLLDYLHLDEIPDADGYKEYYEQQGGESTMRDVDALSKQEKEELAQALMALPFFAVYTNEFGMKVYLSHAGFTPGKLTNEEDLIFNRSHWLDGWDYNQYPNTIVIHGHTPVRYIAADIDPDTLRFGVPTGAYWYCGGFKCCIDCETYISNSCVLLDLDTFDSRIYSCN